MNEANGASTGSREVAKQLSGLNATDDAARKIFGYLAQRRKNSSVTQIDALIRTGVQVERWEAIRVFKALQRFGCGRFKKGRGKGHPTRFEWTTELIDVARAAAGEPVQIKRRLTVDDTPDDVVESTAAGALVEYAHHVRPGTVAKFRLPLDFSEAEAQRFAAFIRTIPFVGAGASAPVVAASAAE